MNLKSSSASRQPKPESETPKEKPYERLNNCLSLSDLEPPHEPIEEDKKSKGQKNTQIDAKIDSKEEKPIIQNELNMVNQLPENQPQEKPEEKPQEKPQEKPEEKLEEKPEVKLEEHPEDNLVEKPEEKTEEKSEDEFEDMPENKPSGKLEEKREDKPSEKLEDKPENKSSVKLEDKPSDKPEEKLDEKSEDKPKDKAEETPEKKAEEVREVKGLPSLSLKSCLDFIEVQQEISEMSYKDAEDGDETKALSEESPKATEKKDPEDEWEAERQERAIRNLYDTIRDTSWLAFENCKFFESKNEDAKDESKPDVTIQREYESTLAEISDIWRNTIGVITSVKNHTLDFMQETNKSYDKEHLTLEAEMLQLAVDFATNYSKLKTEFLIKGMCKRLNVKESEKTEFENLFPVIFNDEDLATMVRTVQDLNRSVLRPETEIELE